MRRIHTIAAAMIAVAIAGGCQRDSAPAAAAQEAPDTKSNTVCAVTVFRRDAVALECKPGQRVAYLPDSWGNEQLPIMFASLHCDLSQSVVVTNGGVACIYKPADVIANEPAPAEPPGKGAGTAPQDPAGG